MGSKSPLVILMMVTLLCAIVPAALGAMLPPSAFAQQEETSLGEEEEEGEDLAGDNIVSDVLDSVDDEEENSEAAPGDGDINRQTAVPIIEQDQGATNLALNEALDVTVVEPRLPPPTTTPADDGGLEPECSLEITADKETYGPGDVVAITVTNTGDVPIEFPDSALGLEIRNVDTGEVFPLDAQPVVVTFEPGASATFQFTYENLVDEIGAGLISATVESECGIEEVTFTLSAPPPPLVENGKIVFTSNRDRNYDIYIMNNDGSEQTRLTNNPAIEEDPNLSPDGTKILFNSLRDGNREIYVMNADGSDQTRLTNSRSDEYGADWSPDGTKIVFGSGDDGEIYVMNADGSNPIRLTNNFAADVLPDWSPDGTKIAFMSTRDKDYEIYVMNADGTEQTRLTYIPGYDGVPDWSPDGEKIAFGHGHNIENQEIYVMNAVDGSELVNISNHPDGDFWPSWSPDGTKIAFMSNRDGGIEIFVMNPDGSEPTNISKYLPAHDEQPDWGPAIDTN